MVKKHPEINESGNLCIRIKVVKVGWLIVNSNLFLF